jgi:hypothetical protein
MDYSALFLTQITDFFRIGLLAGLVYTTERTRAQTGLWLPLVAGIIFVAVIIPSTLPSSSIDFVSAVVAGLFSNAAILAVLMLVWSSVRSKFIK